jgi:hypothetical protein
LFLPLLLIESSFIQTNKALRHIHSQKALWIRILRSVCRRLGLFAGTYPLHDMELLHLQRASMGPQRWRRLNQRYSVSPRELKDAKPLPHAAKLDREWTGLVDSHLVPGGRYFITLTKLENGMARIDLWDLGVPGNGQPPTAISQASAELDMEDDAARCNMDVAIEGDDSLRIGIIPSPPWSVLDQNPAARTL